MVSWSISPNRALLGPDASREVAEMIGRKRHVGAHRLTDRLAVVACLDPGEEFKIFVDPVRNLVQDPRPLGRRRPGPFVPCRVRRIESAFDIVRIRARNLAQGAVIDRALVGEISPFHRSLPLASYEIVVTRPQAAGVGSRLLWLV